MINELWAGGPRFMDGDGVFKLSTDSVLLASFVNTAYTKRAADLGCGSGVISVLLALKNDGLYVDGLEINPDAAALAVENARLCGLSDRITINECDLRFCRESHSAGAYDLVVSNPPYYALGSGKRAKSDSKAQARGEEFCTLEDVCAAAGYLTRWGGVFALVHKPERLSEIFRALDNTGFEPKRMRFVQHRAVSAPSLVLIEARRGGNPSLSAEPPLILTNDDGSDSDEILEIYHRR